MNGVSTTAATAKRTARNASGVAVVSASGFIGAQRLRTVYVVVGFVAGLGSLLIGILFISGLGTALPDLQQVLFGAHTE